MLPPKKCKQLSVRLKCYFRIGRRKTFSILTAMIVPFAIGLYFVKTYIQFVIIRFFIAMFDCVSFVTPYYPTSSYINVHIFGEDV